MPGDWLPGEAQSPLIKSIDNRLGVLETYQQTFNAKVAGLAQRLAAGDVSTAAWEQAMRAEVKKLHINALVLSKGGDMASITFSDWGRLGYYLREQYAYLHNYAQAVATRDHEALAGMRKPYTEKYLKWRAGLYGGNAKASFYRGLTQNLLPQVPGDGQTQCKTNCKCTLHFQEGKEAGLVLVYWHTHPAEHCPDCIRLESEWDPYEMRLPVGISATEVVAACDGMGAHEITGDVLALEALALGGPGSGNWAHRGRPGKVGGSLPRGAGMSIKSGKDWLKRYEEKAGHPHPVAGTLKAKRKDPDGLDPETRARFEKASRELRAGRETLAQAKRAYEEITDSSHEIYPKFSKAQREAQRLRLIHQEAKRAFREARDNGDVDAGRLVELENAELAAWERWLDQQDRVEKLRKEGARRLDETSEARQVYEQAQRDYDLLTQSIDPVLMRVWRARAEKIRVQALEHRFEYRIKEAEAQKKINALGSEKKRLQALPDTKENRLAISGIVKETLRLVKGTGDPPSVYLRGLMEDFNPNPLDPETITPVAEGGGDVRKYQRAIEEFARLMPNNPLVEVGGVTVGVMTRNDPDTDIPPRTRDTGRSFARNGHVYLSRGASHKTILHELGHTVETHDPFIRRLCLSFYDRRTAGEATQPLRVLTDTQAYGPNEVARPDNFRSPYVGRDYGRQATEVLSMGMQWLGADVWGFMEEDPDMFDFVFAAIHAGGEL
jgi:hypothetical protein